MTSRVAFRTCPLCEAMCGLRIELEGDAVTAIRGDADDVFSKGFICPKGAVLGDLHRDPDRLDRPRVRRGSEWREVSWDEAFEAVARGLAPMLKDDRNAVALYLGNPNVHSLDGAIYNRPLVKALRTRNVYTASSVDQMPKHVSSGLLFGSAAAIPVPDLDRTDWLLMLGANPWVSNGSLCTAPDFPGRLKALRDRGGRWILVDPRRTESARRASEHIAIRPGTDALLLAAMVRTLFDEDLVAVGRLADRVTGVDAVRAATRPFAPERVAAACGVDAAVLRRLARELAAAERAAVYGRMGTTTVRFGSLASWLIDVLNTLTGNLDRAGGVMFPRPAHARHRPDRPPGGRGFAMGRWRSRVRGWPEVIGELPVATLADEITTAGDGQIRALLTVAGNPVLSTPNGAQLDRALASLDFMVSVDPYLNETTRHAHVILPPPSQLVRGHYDLVFSGLAVRNVARWSPPVIEPPTGTVQEWEILARLAAIAMGGPATTPPARVDDLVIREVVRREVTAPGRLAGRDVDDILAALEPRRGPARVVDLLVRAGPYGDGVGHDPEGLTLDAIAASPHGVDLGALEPALPGALQTASGTVELAPEALTGDLARAAEILDQPAPELVLIGRRHLRSNNSWMHNVAQLVRGKPRCTLLVHPDDAARLGVRDGELTEVRSRVGRVTATAEVTDTIRPGVVSLPHGWGHDASGSQLSVARSHAGVNSNVLTDDRDIDPISGNAVLNGIPVDIGPVARDS